MGSTAVPASAVGPENLAGRVAFDDTVANFDVDVLVRSFFILVDLRLTSKRVKQYLSGTGSRGGPLVTTTNTTDQSDLRLYESDGNVTMERFTLISRHSMTDD